MTSWMLRKDDGGKPFTQNQKKKGWAIYEDA